MGEVILGDKRRFLQNTKNNLDCEICKIKIINNDIEAKKSHVLMPNIIATKGISQATPCND